MGVSGVLAAREGAPQRAGALAIDECVEDVLAVLLHEVVDVAKDSAGRCVSQGGALFACGQLGAAGQRAYHMVLLSSDCEGIRREGSWRAQEQQLGALSR